MKMQAVPPQTQILTTAYHVSLFGPKMAVSHHVTNSRTRFPMFATSWKAYEQKQTMKQGQKKMGSDG